MWTSNFGLRRCCITFVTLVTFRSLLTALADDGAALLSRGSQRHDAAGGMVDDAELEVALAVCAPRKLAVERDLSIWLVD
ncbi:hypothetical protein [Methylobacterium oxalidis]|uniref:hypothetical protein n=1 Tax=Methylobacterium oxalidis TaxID=944322 RepID=UPI003314F918